MDDFLIRDAKPDDLDFAFDMTVAAGHGFIERFLGANSKSLAYIVFKNLWTGKLNRFHYINGYIAESKGEKVGFLTAYSFSDKKRRSLGALKIISASRFKIVFYYLSHLKELLTAVSLPEGKLGEYYISSIATSSGFRGRGIGTALVDFAIQKAIQDGLNKVSLIVAKDNLNAIRMYNEIGFIQDVFSKNKYSLRLTFDIEQQTQ